MPSTYSRLAKLLPSRPIPQPEYRAILSELKQGYVPPPEIVTNRLQDAAGRIGLQVEVIPNLQELGRSGGMTSDGVLQLSPGLSKGKAKVLAHEMGHWQMNHRGQELPVWSKELEAEAIATDVLARLHPEKSQQHLDYGATYIGGQLGWNPFKQNLADELLMREEALTKAADHIINNMTPERRSRSAFAARMTRSTSTVSGGTGGYDSTERFAYY